MAQLTLSDYKNNLFSNHFLEERIQERENWQEIDFEEKFDNFKDLYDEKEGLLSTNLNEDQTQDNFIDPVLRKLGHDWVTEASKRVGSRTEGKNLNPDYAFMDSSQKLKVHQDNEDPLEINYAVGDAKSWDKKLDRSTQDHNNPAFQIYNYVDRLRADWGILTNGKKWRLYSYEKCAADIYFEVDLENILAGEKTAEKIEAFKYFYLFFRAQSFEDGFLKDIYQESVNFAEGLEDDLEDKVYNSLEVAVEGFFETNDIDKTEENIDLVHHASLIFLYRVLFILNAESRELLPTDDEAYQQAFGLMELKRMIAEEEEDDPLFQDTTVAWDNRLSRLFEGIDEGYDLHETKIPAYNGGLFDGERSEENQFLAENKLYGSYLKEILELLATSKNENLDKRIIVDYKDLNIRHLGSVYEGLLEHQFKAADQRKILKNEQWQNFSGTDKAWEKIEEEKKVKENELYLTNESGERKATGSYYTPEYIVEYIVENTVGPKVEEKIEEAKENNENILPKVLELNVCDPAMGSGHFLTEATEFIAEHIVEHADLEEQDIDENEDELNWAKRQVVQNCIYGVDINPLAVELGKLSLWIETMAEGKPLNFLDHHLKHGNSLIGSDFDEIFSHPTEDQKRLDSERYQFGDPQEIKEGFQEQYLEIEEMPENTVEQIHEKEQAYKQFIQENVLYQQFNQLANIHTRQYFEKEANSSDYESFLINIGNPGNPFENTEWYKNTQQDAENRNYFHWQLEFPKVFFGEQEGFDAVVGNPPYIRIQNMTADRGILDFFEEEYETPNKNYDIYVIFNESGFNNLGEGGRLGYIQPSKYFKTDYGKNLREFLTWKTAVDEIVDFSENQIFEGVTTYTCLTFLQKSESDTLNYQKIPNGEYSRNIKQFKKNEIRYEDLSSDEWNFEKLIFKDIFEKLDDLRQVSDITEEIYTGTQTSNNEIYVVEKISEDEEHMRVSSGVEEDFLIEKEILEKWLDGKQVDAYNIKDSGKFVISPYTNDDDANLIGEDKIEEEYPKAYEYLCRHKEDLLEREGIEEDKWYAFGYPKNMTKFPKEKIVCPGIAKVNSFALDEENHYFKGAYSFPVEECEMSKFHVLGILNSKLMTKYVETITSKLRGGYLSFYSKYINPIPVVPENDEVEEKAESIHNSTKEFKQEKNSFLEWVEAEWGVDVDDLSLKTHLREYWEYDFDEFMRVAKKNKSQVDGNVKSRDFRELMKEEWESSMDTLRPLMQEIDELENEIDAIVFDLYDLTEEEVETVLDSLDTGEGEKASIFKNFNEV